KLNKEKSKIIKSDKYYKILFIFSGRCHIKFNNKINKCSTDNIILIYPNNKIEIELQTYTPLIIYELEITENLLNTLSEEEVNLTQSFNAISFEILIIDANAETAMLVKNILKKLIYMKQEPYRFADNIYIKSMITIVLILTLRSCINSQSKQKNKRNKQFLI
ncbi:TPA: AraC family transcriptional regulator, partial [Clostridium perfringens]|nr:AraC family transcriptional regulator [Clostridium perfringens]